MTISRSIHVATYGVTLFFLITESYSIVYMYHIFFIHSSGDGHLDYFQVLAIVNSAAMNTGVHVSFQIMIFSWYMARNGVAVTYANSSFSFLRNCHTVFHCDCTNLHSYKQQRSVPLSLHPLQHSFVDLNDGHSDQHEMVPCCSFYLHFSNN